MASRWNARAVLRVYTFGMAALGSAEEFADHYRAEASACLGLAYVLCGNRSLAEEVVADAFARSWPAFRAGRIDDVRPYLRRTVVNTLNGRFRRRVLERRHAARIGAEPEPVETGGADQVNDQAWLWPALLELPPTQRAVLVLRFLEDRSEQQTADLLGIRVGTVKSRSARGLARLQDLLGDANDD